LAKSGRVGVLTARVGSIGDNRLGGWHSYRASKAAANQLIRGAAIELSRTHKGSVVAALHPGTVDTPFTAGYKAQKLSPEASATKLIAVLDGLSADQTGGFFDYSGAEVPW
jgi:NAD(P)-dependent dehydrogenase (short-subunit alcohol dehydrogenase family)